MSRLPRVRLALRKAVATMGLFSSIWLPSAKMTSAFSISLKELVIAPVPSVLARPVKVAC